MLIFLRSLFNWEKIIKMYVWQYMICEYYVILTCSLKLIDKFIFYKTMI
jgi:hypothetical protein